MSEQTLPIFGNTRRLICLAVSLIAGICIYNQILNAHYATGTTLFDATFWGTLSWRNDWLLSTPPAMGGMSFFNYHISPIHWLPNALSFFYPGSRISYYALVYGGAFALMTTITFRLCAPLYGQRYGAWLGGACALAWFLSEPIFKGMWEPHMELLSPLFALLMYQAWFKGQMWRTALFLLLNASIREDVALFFCVPMAVMTWDAWRAQRAENPLAAKAALRRGVYIVGFSVALTAVAVFVQKTYFTQYNILGVTYYDPAHPFSHLSAQLLGERLRAILTQHPGVWCPVALLAAAAIVWRDWRLMAGVVGFVPYFLVNFLSKDPLSATMGSYKAFPFITVMLWPALLACAPAIQAKARLAGLQLAMLVAGVCYVGADDIAQMKVRFVPQPLSANATAYDAMGTALAEHVLPGNVRASDAVTALYPYDFGYGYNTYQPLNLDNISLDQIDTLIFIPNDRFFDKTEAFLRGTSLPYHYHVAGTLMFITTRLPIPPSMSGLLEPIVSRQ